MWLIFTVWDYVLLENAKCRAEHNYKQLQKSIREKILVFNKVYFYSLNTEKKTFCVLVNYFGKTDGMHWDYILPAGVVSYHIPQHCQCM